MNEGAPVDLWRWQVLPYPVMFNGVVNPAPFAEGQSSYQGVWLAAVLSGVQIRKVSVSGNAQFFFGLYRVVLRFQRVSDGYEMWETALGDDSKEFAL